MKRCRICGAENEDGAIACRDCGIRFSRQASRTRFRRQGDWMRLPQLMLFVGIVVGVLVLFKEQSRHAERIRLAVAQGGRDEAPAEDQSEPVDIESGGAYQRYEDRTPESWNLHEVITDRQEVCGGARRTPPYDLGKEFVDIKAWDIDMNRFMREHPRIWYSKDGETNLSVSGEYVLFFGYAVCEDMLHFGVDGLESIDVSVFNKGIAGALVSEQAAMEAISHIATQLPGTKLETMIVDDGRGKSVTHFSWSGAWPRVTAKMGYAAKDGQGSVEYLNVRFERIVVPSVTKASRNPAENVRCEGGDIYIEGIPMINQGRKGYCVPASVARVLQYYGIDTDIHELAMLMETDCGGGTKVGGRFPTLSRVAKEAGMRRIDYKNLEKYDEAYIRRYNQAARANSGHELNIEDFTVEEEEDGRVVNMRHYDWLVDAMDEGLKLRSRDYDEEGFSTFKEGIVTSVQQGRPLLWSVEHLFPWDRADGSQGGGHMRLIVGVNQSRDEILYSDSWGVGNEFKRVGFADAWRETDFMSCLFPR